MYRKIEDFVNDWKYESAATLKVLNNLTDESLDKKFSDNVRTPGRLAWHITSAVPITMNQAGIHMEGPDRNTPAPSRASEIAETYKNLSAKLPEIISQNWTDDSLIEKINVFGEDWERGKLLSIVVIHQTHHRGQLTVVMRLAGLKVPGVYGPSKEEWAGMGMPAQE